MKSVQFSFNLETKEWDGLPPTDLWDNKDTLALVFASPTLSHSLEDSDHPIRALSQKFPSVSLVGCSTSGEIVGSALFDKTIAIVFMKFEKSHFKISVSSIPQADGSFESGAELAQSFEFENLKGLLVFSDGLQANGTQLVKGINSQLPEGVVVGGGLAGDGTEFEKTFIISGLNILTNNAIAVGFYGDELEIQSVARGGWDIFGPPREITKSKNNTLFEIDGKPALDLYKNYLGDKTSELPASGLLFPLEISPPGFPELKLVRTILAIDEKEKSLIFAGDVPEGWSAQLMRANLENVIDASQEAYLNIQNESVFTGGGEVVVAVSCVGRRLILGERCEDELDVIREEMPQEAILTGFYSYGELASNSQGKACDLHNQTMTLFSIREAA